VYELVFWSEYVSGSQLEQHLEFGLDLQLGDLWAHVLAFLRVME
jgi:hypothetical protein